MVILLLMNLLRLMNLILKSYTLMQMMKFI
nr:MAG TPA: hypothetical protein [Bacteriophage sp.]